jgi:hypothetical protein
MEQADTEFQKRADDLFAWGEEVVGVVGCVGFDSEPVAASEAEDERAPAKSRPRRRSKVLVRPHAVRVWFDDREIGSVTDCAAAEGIDLADFVRDRALRGPQVEGGQASLTGADLFVPTASPAPPDEPSIPPLSPELEQRINAYYASGPRFPAIAPGDRSVVETRVERKRFARLGHFFTALVGA